MYSLEQILTNHFARTPAMQAQDVYKLLFQAALGSEHAVDDEKSVRVWLARELIEMGTDPDDPLLDPISPDGQILRVHLRPYLRSGKDLEILLQAFIRTGSEWRASTETLKAYGGQAAHLLQAGTGSIRPEDFEAYFADMEKQGFPAVHHSVEYTRLYRPAYRVVASQFLEAI
jgi:hypothetical protein